jgi:hypothetical protein
MEFIRKSNHEEESIIDFIDYKNGYLFLELKKKDSNIVKSFKYMKFLTPYNLKFVNMGYKSHDDKILCVKICNENYSYIRKFLLKNDFENKNELIDFLDRKYRNEEFMVDYDRKNNIIRIHTNIFQLKYFFNNIQLYESNKINEYDNHDFTICFNEKNDVYIEYINNILKKEKHKEKFINYRNFVFKKYEKFFKLEKIDESVSKLLTFMEIHDGRIVSVGFDFFNYLLSLFLYSIVNNMKIKFIRGRCFHKHAFDFVCESKNRLFFENEYDMNIDFLDLRKIIKQVLYFIDKEISIEKSKNFTNLNYDLYYPSFYSNDSVFNLVNLMHRLQDYNFEDFINKDRSNILLSFITHQYSIYDKLFPCKYNSFVFDNDNNLDFDGIIKYIVNFNMKKRNYSYLPFYKFIYFVDKLHVEKENCNLYDDLAENILEFNGIIVNRSARS